MNLPCRWEILLISLWIQVGFVPGMLCEDGPVNHLSREDVLLLKDEQDPKCFTRTQEDFTCFFETADNRTYDFLYKVDISPPREKRCELSVQRTEEGTFRHICSFAASDVFMHVDTHVKVMERNTSTSLYSRIVYVEDHLLLDPPINMSLNQNGQARQLQVSWHVKGPKYLSNTLIYRVRYSSKGMEMKTKKGAKVGDILESLVPGEEVEAQVAVKDESDGHWSSWSQPARTMVPQSADDISLMCYTSDLRSITCQWNGSRYGVHEYKLFYKMDLSHALGWTEWTECLPERNLTDLCRFHGNESRKIRVKLSSAPAPLNRTFYSQEFTLNKSIKTSPPSGLTGKFEKDKLRLTWEAPLPSLSAHLQYEVGQQIRGGEAWMTTILKGPETDTLLEVPTGSQFSVKLRTKPNGSIYSGHWSDWSEVLTGDNPTDISTLLLLCIPFLMLITAVILISLFSTYLSKLKQYIWPPVPNLDKFLQAFLMEINGQKWNPPITAKQCFEEIASSVVEVMSKDEVSELGKPSEESTQFLSPERSVSRREQVDGSPGTQVFPDYVTLNRDSVILCPKGNKYVYKQVGEKESPVVRDELLQTCHCSCTDGSAFIPPCLGTDFLNHSYLSLAESAHGLDCKVTAARGPGNLYTNFPCG